MDEEKLEEAQKMEVNIGDTILVELSDGEKFEGIFDIHPLASYCVRNQHGFPINYKKILNKIT